MLVRLGKGAKTTWLGFGKYHSFALDVQMFSLSDKNVITNTQRNSSEVSLYPAASDVHMFKHSLELQSLA